MSSDRISTDVRTAIVSIAALLTLALSAASAKTPDGVTPSEEDVCDGLQGAAFGLCNAYCEAQDCDVHARPSCEVLRANFEKHTGSAVFPCDVAAACGDGTIDPGEECDPPGSACMDETICDDDCTCSVPACGNGTIDPGEDCDPPGSPCQSGASCSDTCLCPAPTCCQCVDPDGGSTCLDSSMCPPGCAVFPNAVCVGTACVPSP